MSRNTVLVLMLVLGLFGAWRHFKAAPAQTPADSPASASSQLTESMQSAVVVYGRDGCGYTRNMIGFLQAANVPHAYINIDYADAYDAFHDRFDNTGLAGERGYALPVVEVAGRASMRPDPDTVISAYRRLR